ncbi:MAG: diguanylate cyclase [Sulfuritalea sp.]|nr:diguanylate cyclase [Sulfuritalea sp.]
MATGGASESVQRKHASKVIFAGFGIVIALMLFLAASTLKRMERIDESIREISEQHTITAQHAHKMYDLARERIYLLVNIGHTDDLFAADELAIRFKTLEYEFGQIRQKLMTQNLLQEEKALLEEQRLAAVDTMRLQEIFLDLVFAGKKEQAEEVLIKQVLPAQEKVLIALSQVIVMQNREVSAASKAASEQEYLVRLFLLIGTGVATLLSVGIAFYVRESLSGLVRGLSDKSEQLRLSLRDLEFQKQALDEHAIVSIADRRGRIIYVNDRFCEVSQYARQELIGKDHSIVNSGGHPKEFFRDMWRTISSGTIWHGQVRNRRKDGSFYWVDTTILPFIGDDGRPDQYVSIRTEITAIKKAEAVLMRDKAEQEALVAQRTEELSEREAVLQKITGAAQDAIFMIDHQDRVTFWNTAAEKLFGYSREEIMGQPLPPLLMPTQSEARHDAAVDHFIITGKWGLLDKTTELSARRRDGREVPVDLSLSAIQVKGEWCGIGIIHDISRRKETEAELKLLADTDALTQLPNRRKFDAVFAAEISRAQRYEISLSFVMLDIDHFKAVNDTHGHQTGDFVLVELARIVSTHIRANDVFARWGGEEFAILAMHSDCEATRHFADKLRTLVADHDFQNVGHLTISLGLASYQTGDSIETLMERADKALYMAKSGGRNRVECL